MEYHIHQMLPRSEAQWYHTLQNVWLKAVCYDTVSISLFYQKYVILNFLVGFAEYILLPLCTSILIRSLGLTFFKDYEIQLLSWSLKFALLFGSLFFCFVLFCFFSFLYFLVVICNIVTSKLSWLKIFYTRCSIKNFWKTKMICLYRYLFNELFKLSGTLKLFL